VTLENCLSWWDNIYPKLGGQEVRIASVDIGSNSILLLIADVDGDGAPRAVVDEIEIVRLGQGVHKNRRFHPEALKRTAICFERYSKLIHQNSVDKVLAVATSASRDVDNGQELVDLGKKYGIPISIISGDLEAQLSYDGSTYDLPDRESVVIVDIGGGSTEYLCKNSQSGLVGRSIDIGCVRLFELFHKSDPMVAEDICTMREYIAHNLSNELGKSLQGRFSRLVAVAGTPTTLACMIQEKDFLGAEIDGFMISTQVLAEWSNRLLSLPIKERVLLKGLDSKRVDVIPIGAVILEESLRFLQANSCSVSTKGVRYGAVIHHYLF
jgi:exopolyphosphatase/guanosine-5'-triphosphate,3'-diphosphate pyrophosphatase